MFFTLSYPLFVIPSTEVIHKADTSLEILRSTNISFYAPLISTYITIFLCIVFLYLTIYLLYCIVVCFTYIYSSVVFISFILICTILLVGYFSFDDNVGTHKHNIHCYTIQYTHLNIECKMMNKNVRSIFREQ